VWNLWMADLGSGELTRLTRHSYGQVWAGSWFPDGRRIGYSHETRFIVLDLARDDGQGRMTSYPSPIEGRLVRTPAVAPDGRHVILQVSRDGAWILDLADGSMRRVLDDPTAEEFAWSPDGSRVVFHSRRGGSWGLWTAAMERQRPPNGHGSSPRD
jgi:Tol biopolymer transport system component